MGPAWSGTTTSDQHGHTCTVHVYTLSWFLQCVYMYIPHKGMYFQGWSIYKGKLLWVRGLSVDNAVSARNCKCMIVHLCPAAVPLSSVQLHVWYIQVRVSIYLINGSDIIEGKVEPAQVSGRFHKQPGHGVSKPIPAAQHVVVQSQSCTSGQRNLQIDCVCGVICSKLVLQH